MALRRNSLGVLFLALTLALTACGKKDDSALKSKSGARATDPAGVQAAQAQGAADGVTQLDLIEVNKTYDEMNGTTWINAKLSVNNVVRDVWTPHGGATMAGQMAAMGSTQFDKFNVTVSAFCKDAACNQYYFMADVMSGNVTKLQFSVKYDFANNNQRWYSLKTGANRFGTINDVIAYMDNEANFYDQ